MSATTSQQRKGPLRLITYSSLHDGLSTLIGSLFDSVPSEPEHQPTSTIGHRLFGTTERKFMLVNGPGEEQLNHDMVADAATAEVALILLDAQKRHTTTDPVGILIWCRYLVSNTPY